MDNPFESKQLVEGIVYPTLDVLPFADVLLFFAVKTYERSYLALAKTCGISSAEISKRVRSVEDALREAIEGGVSLRYPDAFVDDTGSAYVRIKGASRSETYEFTTADGDTDRCSEAQMQAWGVRPHAQYDPQ